MSKRIVELNGNVLNEDNLKKNFEHFYVGHLVDEQNDSFASGILLNKSSFFGTIKSQKLGNFYIEPARRFSNDSNEYESIMYNEVHLRPERLVKKRSLDGSETKDSPETGSCAYEKVKKWMNTEQKTIFEEKMKNEVIFLNLLPEKTRF